MSLDLIALRRLAAPAQPAFTTRREVQTARRCLSPREDRVIALLFDLGWQNREVAAELREVNVEGVEPAAHAFPVCDVVRADEPRPGLTQEEALRHAPRAAHGLFIVTKVVE